MSSISTIVVLTALLTAAILVLVCLTAALNNLQDSNSFKSQLNFERTEQNSRSRKKFRD
jgi:type IV secretory pathway VirB3-like protein